MGKAKDVILRPISASEANDVVRRYHYSGKVVQNSQIHMGAFYHGRLEGALQFGPSLDKRKLQGLVEGTKWNEFIELNRMAFSDRLPRNSESRAIAVAMRLLRKHAPHIKWVVSYADATQCGDGTIYRASGFVLTDIKKNNSTWVLPDGQVVSQATFSKSHYVFATNGAASAKRYLDSLGAKKAVGYQLRYVYFLDPAARERLTVDEIPFERLDELAIRMYKGEKLDTRAESIGSDAPDDQSGEGGAIPTSALVGSDHE